MTMSAVDALRCVSVTEKETFLSFWGVFLVALVLSVFTVLWGGEKHHFSKRVFLEMPMKKLYLATITPYLPFLSRLAYPKTP